jgi:DNA-binding MarR family transcriptional regulator
MSVNLVPSYVNKEGQAKPVGGPGSTLTMIASRRRPASLPARQIGKLRSALGLLCEQGGNMTCNTAISLLTVAMFEGRSAREYQELLNLSQSTMSRHLLDLGDITRKREPGLQLIEQHTDPDDRRKQLYHLTPKGRALVAALVAAIQA